MAGIGFRLQKLLKEDTFTSSVKAYAYSALIMAGPLLITIATLSILHWYTFSSLTLSEQALLRSLVTYAFAFSLVAVGVVHLPLTRYVADSTYKKHISHFSASFFSSTCLNFLIWSVPCFLFLSKLDCTGSIKLLFYLLFNFALGVWLALVFLSAAKNYMRPVFAFTIGSLTGLILALLLGDRIGLSGYLCGFVFGQGVTFFALTYSILKEFGYTEAQDWHWIQYLRKYPTLVLLGLFYNVGIWVDKFIFWLSYESVEAIPGVRFSPIYDGPMFLAYLTIIPALAYFLIQMETEFFFKYQAYYTDIQLQKSLDILEDRRKKMVQNLEVNITKLIFLQTVVSGLVLLMVPWIRKILNMDPLYMSVFRIGILGAYLQVGFLIFINLLLYFDFQKETLWGTLIFFLSNAILTTASLRFGLIAYGYGYTISCFIGLVFTFFILNSRLHWLHYWTFMKQPLFKPVQIIEDNG